jgi:hypothetical protein
MDWRNPEHRPTPMHDGAAPSLLLRAAMGQRDPGSDEPPSSYAQWQGWAPPLLLCSKAIPPMCPPFNRQARLVWHSLIRQGSWWKEQEDSVVEKKEGNAEKQWLTVDAVWKCNTCWRLALCRVHRIYSRSHVNVRLQWDFAILC